MRKQIVLQLKSVNRLKVIFALKKCCADNKFLEYSGAHAIGYFDCVGFGFLRSEHVQLRARISVSTIEMPKSYRRNADEIRNAFQNRHCMPKSRCQKPNAKECKHDLSSNQHTEKVMKYEKKLRWKVNMLQCPSSLKQMNFKTECFSSLLVTMDTEVIIFNIWPVVNNNETQ